MALTIVLTGKDKSKATLGPAVKGFKSTFASAFKSNERLAKASATRLKNIFGSVGKGIGKVLKAATSPLGLAVGGVGGVLAFKRLLDGAAALEVSLTVLENRTGKSGKSLNQLIDTVNDASFGLLNFRQAAQLLNRSGIAGVGIDNLRTLVEFVSKAGAAAGIKNPFSDLVRGLDQLGRGTPVLAKFGLGKDLEKVGLEFDKAFGPGSFKGLSVAKQKVVFMDSIFGEMREKIKDMALTGKEMIFKFQGLSGSISDIADSLGTEIFGGQAFGGKFRLFADTLELVAKATKEKGGPAKILNAFGSQIIPTLGGLFETLGALITKGMIKTLEPILGGTALGRALGFTPGNIKAALAVADAQIPSLIQGLVSSTSVVKRAAREALGLATSSEDRTIKRHTRRKASRERVLAARESSDGLGQLGSILASGKRLGLTPDAKAAIGTLGERRSLALQGLIDERANLNSQKAGNSLSLSGRSRLRLLNQAFLQQGRGSNRGINRLLPDVDPETKRSLRIGTGRAINLLNLARRKLQKQFLDGEVELRDRNKQSNAILAQKKALQASRGDAQEMAAALKSFNEAFKQAAVEAKKAAEQSKQQLDEVTKTVMGSNSGAS